MSLPNLSDRATGASLYAPVNRRTQAANPEAIAAAVAHARWIADEYSEHLPPSTALAGARVLEIGPGPSFGTAVVLACRGARVTVADRYLAAWEDEFHMPFFRALMEDVSSRPAESADPIRLLLDARAFVPDAFERVAASAETLPCQDASFDIVLSSAVFEHVHHVPDAVRNLARITVPGGIALHGIDFRDHRDYERPLEYLTLDPELFWSMFEMRWSECGNRWRHTDFADAFTCAGFDVLHVEPVRVAQAEYIHDVRARLHVDFATCSDDELGTLCGWLVGRRAHRDATSSTRMRPGLTPIEPPLAHARSLLRGQRIAIYGAGAGGWYALDMLDRIGCAGSVVAVCDSDAATWGRAVRQHQVTGFCALPQGAYDLVIIASEPGREGISKRLMTAGLIERPELAALGFVGGFARPAAAVAA